MIMEQFYSPEALCLNIRGYLKIDVNGYFVYPRVVTVFPKTPDLTKDVNCFITHMFNPHQLVFRRNVIMIPEHSALYYV